MKTTYNVQIFDRFYNDGECGSIVTTKAFTADKFELIWNDIDATVTQNVFVLLKNLL